MKINEYKQDIVLVIITLIISIPLVYYSIIYDNYRNILEDYSYDNLDRLREYEDDRTIRVYKINDGGILQIINMMGYNDLITILVEINNKEINNVEIINHSETEDYAGYITEDWFLKRLQVSTEKRLEVVKMSKKNENEIVAVTGATISTNSIVKGLNFCIKKYEVIINEK